MENVIGILLILDTETEFESGIAPDVIIDGAIGFLSGQDEVYPQAAAHLRHADKLSHKIGLVALQFGKFIYDDKQMWDCDICFSSLKKPGILVDVIYTELAEYFLAPSIFTLN